MNAVTTVNGLPGGLRRRGFVATRAVAIAALAAIVLASFAPWLRSGERTRSSYDLVKVIDRIELLGGGSLRWLPAVWVCVPLLAAVALACFVAGAPRWAASVGAVVGGFALVVGWAVLEAPLRAEWGSRVAVGGGALVLISGTAVIATATSQERNPR